MSSRREIVVQLSSHNNEEKDEELRDNYQIYDEKKITNVNKLPKIKYALSIIFILLTLT